MPRVSITVPGQNAQPYRFALDREVVKLGRAADNDFVINSPSVSSYHCEIHRVPGGYILKDSGSTNGIKLDSERMDVIDLENDSDIHVGDAEFAYELSSEELATLAEESHTPQNQVQLPLAEEMPVEEEPEPAPQAPPQRAAAPPSYAQKNLSSAKNNNAGLQFLITVSLLGLAILSFYFGMSTRHQAKTSRSLINDLTGRSSPAEQQEEAESAEQ